MSVESWAVFDNFLIRMILGKNGLKLPIGSVTEEHAHQAIRTLSKFDVVTLVEEFDDLGLKVLGEELGWRTTAVKENVQHRAHAVSNADIEYLKERTKMDFLVYNFFKQA